MMLNITESSIAWLVDLQPCRKDDYETFGLQMGRSPFQTSQPVWDRDALQVRELFPQRYWLVSTRLQSLLKYSRRID